MSSYLWELRGRDQALEFLEGKHFVTEFWVIIYFCLISGVVFLLCTTISLFENDSPENIAIKLVFSSIYFSVTASSISLLEETFIY